MVLSNHFKISKPLRWIRLDRLIFKLIKYSKYARNATFWGFVYLMIAIVFLFFANIVSSFFPDVVPLLRSPIRQVCEKNLEDIDMTLDLCSRIKPGSLYEECVKNTMPNLLDVKECSKFMTT